MNNSSLEITENEYCIKLNKEAFDLTLIRQLIKRIQSEQHFFNRTKDDGEDIISRAKGSFEEDNYDRLCDK